MCELMKIVFPSPASNRTRRLNSTRALGSNPAAGFIEDEHLRVVQQRAAEAKPLRHALGELVHHTVGDAASGR